MNVRFVARMAMAIAVLAVLPACAGATEEPTLQPLDDAGLTRTFTGTAITNAEIASNAGPEMFYPDGSYAHQSRATVRGRYSVERGALCVTTDLSATPMCRRFARNRAGEIFELWETGAGRPVATKYIVRPIETRP